MPYVSGSPLLCLNLASQTTSAEMFSHITFAGAVPRADPSCSEPWNLPFAAPTPSAQYLTSCFPPLHCLVLLTVVKYADEFNEVLRVRSLQTKKKLFFAKVAC